MVARLTYLIQALNSPDPIQVETTSFGFEHVVGDLTYIMPTFAFEGFKANSQVSIPMVLEYWSTQETDMMPVSPCSEAILEHYI